MFSNIRNIKEESLSQALSEAGCKELPKAFNENGYDFWLKAIGCVKKCNGGLSYCLLGHRVDGMVIYERDFGYMSPIAGLVSVHPYIFLDKNRFYFPLKRTAIENQIDTICSCCGYTPSEVRAFDDEMFEQSLLRVAIKRQEEENKRLNDEGIRELNEEYDRKLSEYDNDEDRELAESRMDVMDEDGMITIASAHDFNPDTDDSDLELDYTGYQEEKKKREKEAEHTSDGDKVVEVIKAPSMKAQLERKLKRIRKEKELEKANSDTDNSVGVSEGENSEAPAKKKRGRPRKNPEVTA